MWISHCHVSLPEGRTLSWGVGYFYQILSCHYSHLDADWSGLNGHATPGLAKFADFFGFAHQLMIVWFLVKFLFGFKKEIAKHVSNKVGFWKNICLKRFLIILLIGFFGEQGKNTHRPVYVTRLSQFSILSLDVKADMPPLHCVFMVHVGWFLGWWNSPCWRVVFVAMGVAHTGCCMFVCVRVHPSLKANTIAGKRV